MSDRERDLAAFSWEETIRGILRDQFGPAAEGAGRHSLELEHPALGGRARLTLAELLLRVVSESYMAGRARGRLVPLYYRVKKLVPRPVQLALQGGQFRRARADFPFAFPFDPILLQALARARREGGFSPRPAFWPENRQAALIVTHDVDTGPGQTRVHRLTRVEEEVGLRAAYNFVLRRYPLDESLLRDLKSRGHEVGCHGLLHDGKLFENPEVYRTRMDLLLEFARRHDVAGFRAPSLLRRAEWLAREPWLYDSSFPLNEPGGPQPGGIHYPYPFRLGRLIELPITLPQDHLLWNVLRQENLDAWIGTAERLIEEGGLLVLLTHPDYTYEGRRLDLYRRFLERCRADARLWIALPREVAAWWRQRESDHA